MSKNMMGILPEIHNGDLLYADDSKGLVQFLEMLPPIKRVHAQRLMRNDGMTVRQALERVGVAFCERAPKPKVREWKEQPPKEDD